MKEDDIWYYGVMISEKCNKCRDKVPSFVFLGMPLTLPNVSISLCVDCYNELPKEIFRLIEQVEAEL